MNLEALTQLLSEKNGATKEFPFGEEAMVFKVRNKMFALVAWQENPLHVTLKSLPEDALGYREIYDCVRPGYYMNKKHWNTIAVDGSMKDDVLIEMINESYSLVVSKLTKKERVLLQEQNG